MENVTLVHNMNKKNLPKKATKKPGQPTLGAKFMAAGLAACFADMVTFPLDTAKVRLQIQGEGSSPAKLNKGGSLTLSSPQTAKLKYRGIIGTACVITKEEGAKALYSGIVPGLQRQMAFASIRIGLYDTIKQGYMNFFKVNGSNSMGGNVGLRILAGMTTGAGAVLIAQPTDVVKVRMQASGIGAARYSGTIDAYRTIGRQEGVRGLWKGTSPNIARNCIVTSCELVSYDLIKEAILSRGWLQDNIVCHFTSGFGAGFCTTVIASPVDVVKTRIMNASPGKYNGIMHCASCMYKEGGLKAFYKGFMPSFMRLGSWNIVMFVTFEQLKQVFFKFQDKPAVTKMSTDFTNVSKGNKKFA